MLNDLEKQACLQIVRQTIAYHLKLTDRLPAIGDEGIAATTSSTIFTEQYGLFVTLHKHQRLRGCIGYVLPYKPLFESLLDLSFAAAFKDNRFRPVSADEFDDLHIEISILSPLYEIVNYDEIQIGRDGLLIKHPYGSGLLLPQVATQYGWDRDTFLEETCQKAGLDKSFLDDPQTKIYRFEAEIFSEDT